MRYFILALMLFSLLSVGAGCFKKEENPYKNLVPSGSAPALPAKPSAEPVIPPEAKNIPPPNSGK